MPIYWPLKYWKDRHESQRIIDKIAALRKHIA